MRQLVERAYFFLCFALGWVLRTARYSRARIVDRGGERRVHKRRLFYAPLLIWMGGPLSRILDTGVRVVTQREWEERERLLYDRLHGESIQVAADGLLILPCLPGQTLATLLDDPQLADSSRKRAIDRAAFALAELHGLGFTHGDAMAENVLVDLDAGIARWFDFETVHDATRPMAWRRADDVRALLVTCVVRSAPAKLPETVQLILRGYADDDVTRHVAASFAAIVRRPLAFHLAQAGLSFGCYREIGQHVSTRQFHATYP